MHWPLEILNRFTPLRKRISTLSISVVVTLASPVAIHAESLISPECQQTPALQCDKIQTTLNKCEADKRAIDAALNTSNATILEARKAIAKVYFGDSGADSMFQKVQSLMIQFDKLTYHSTAAGVSDLDNSSLGAFLKEFKKLKPSLDGENAGSLFDVFVQKSIELRKPNGDDRFFDTELACKLTKGAQDQIAEFAASNQVKARENCIRLRNMLAKGVSDAIDDDGGFCGEEPQSELILQACKPDAEIPGFPTYSEIFLTHDSGAYHKLNNMLQRLNGIVPNKCALSETECDELSQKTADVATALPSKANREADSATVKKSITSLKGEREKKCSPQNALGSGEGLRIIKATYQPRWAKPKSREKFKCDATADLILACQSIHTSYKLCFEKLEGSSALGKATPKGAKEKCTDMVEGSIGQSKITLLQSGSLKSVCDVSEISHRKLCGGLNPVPFAEKELIVDYNCSGGKNSDGQYKTEGRRITRDKGRLFLSCLEGQPPLKDREKANVGTH